MHFRRVHRWRLLWRGGSWRRGSRLSGFYAGDLQAFADKHDCVVASIGYRLSRWRWRALFLLNPLLLVLQMSLVCALLALSAVHQGARYYHHAFGKKMAKALKQALDDELVK